MVFVCRTPRRFVNIFQLAAVNFEKTVFVAIESSGKIDRGTEKRAIKTDIRIVKSAFLRTKTDRTARAIRKLETMCPRDHRQERMRSTLLHLFPRRTRECKSSLRLHAGRPLYSSLRRFVSFNCNLCAIFSRFNALR